jgi:hypothetical protein
MNGGDKAKAKTHHDNAISWFKTLKDNFKKLNKQPTVTATEYNTLKATLDEKFEAEYLPLKKLAKDNQVVRGHGDPDFEKWHNDVKKHYDELISLAAEVHEKVQ